MKTKTEDYTEEKDPYLTRCEICKRPLQPNNIKGHGMYFLCTTEGCPQKITAEQILQTINTPQEKTIKTKYTRKEYSEIKNTVLQKIIIRQIQSATEIITQIILENENIKTIRDDNISEIWIYQDGIYTPNGETYIKEICRGILGEAYQDKIVNEVVSKIQTETYIRAEEFFKEEHPELVAVQNGILNLKTRKLQDFTPEVIFFNKIRAEYDETKKCPNIIKFITEITKDPEDVQVMQEFIGFTMYRDYFIEKSGLFNGNGGNGKSKTNTLIKEFLGPENVINLSIQRLDDDQYAAGELHRKLANLGADISGSTLKETATFKASTGRDFMSSNRKYKNPINFVNYAKHVFSCNTVPITLDTSEGFWRRWFIIEFPHRFVNKTDYERATDKKGLKIADPNIIENIKSAEEFSGLLNWGIDGLHRLFLNKEFTLNPSSRDVRIFWIRKSDSFEAFIQDMTEKSVAGELTKQELKSVYVSYCQENSLKVRGDNHITRIMSAHGYWDRQDHQGVRHWVGIVLRTSVRAQQAPQAQHSFLITPPRAGIAGFSQTGVAGVAPVALQEFIENSSQNDKISSQNNKFAKVIDFLQANHRYESIAIEELATKFQIEINELHEKLLISSHQGEIMAKSPGQWIGL